MTSDDDEVRHEDPGSAPAEPMTPAEEHRPDGDHEAHALQGRRHVGRDRRRHEHLLGAGHQLRQLGAPLGVELGEDVVEHEDRVVAVGAEQVVRRQPERQREGPRLPVRGVALDREPEVAVPEGEQELVAVRADERDAAVELVLAPRGDRVEDRLLEGVS